MARGAPFRRKLSEELRNPNFAREYTAELERLRIAEQIAKTRQAAGLTQEELARRMRTSQPAVARLERGDYTGYKIATLEKAAFALGRRLRVELGPAPPSVAAAYTVAKNVTSSVKYAAKKKVSRSGAKKKK